MPEGRKPVTIQTRETVLKRIRSYLRKNPKELKGVRSLEKHRLNALIQRLNEYSPIETLRWNVPDRQLFREIALAAGIQFVRQYPFLYHTPNSLRACFGMPTRSDRKKGRFSSIFYRNEAVERQLRPKFEDLDDLEVKLQEYSNSAYKEDIVLLVKYINIARNRRVIDDLLETPESDHSEESIEKLKDFLKVNNFINIKEAKDISEDHLEDLDGVILAPDMIAYWHNIECWIELKEYKELKFNSKVVYQVFRYLLQNPFVLLLSISPLPSFLELLENPHWNAQSLRNWGYKHQDRLNETIENWHHSRNTYMNLGLELNLSPRFEALYLALTNEIVTREIGLAGTELRGIEKFLNILPNFGEEDITISEFDSFINANQAPVKYCLLLKMDYETKQVT